MGTQTRPSFLRWASGYVVTAERAGNALLVMGTIGLIVAFCLPWWSLRVFPYASRNSYLLVSHGFSGWGWLSVAAGLVALALTVRLTVTKGAVPGTKARSRTLGWATMVAGAAEFAGNALFINTAPKTEIFIGAGQGATRGVGLTIATVAGAVIVVSGLFMVASHRRRSPRTAAPLTTSAPSYAKPFTPGPIPSAWH